MVDGNLNRNSDSDLAHCLILNIDIQPQNSKDHKHIHETLELHSKKKIVPVY